MNNRASRHPLPLVILLLGPLAPLADAESFAEPSTVFYGKVTGTGSGPPFLVTEGELTWTIRRADGTDLGLRAPLFPLNGGEISYRLDVPHTVLGLGLVADSSVPSVPLTPRPENHAHLSIGVNGMPAVITGPNGSTFDADQARRAATYRLDLEVALEDLDSDGDGMSDRWEDLHGLDKQDPGDANGDLDGDGITNLAEFLGGTDPDSDNRDPKLVSREMLAYRGATTGLILEVTDSDSDPEVILITLDAAPQGGTLYRRNARLDPSQPDVPLAAGERFSLRDVRRGLIAFVPHEPLVHNYDRLELSVEDEDPAHAGESGTVEILYYQPPASVFGNLAPSEAHFLAEYSRPVAGLSEPGAQRFRNHILGGEMSYLLRDAGPARAGVSQSTPTSGMSVEDYEQFHKPAYGPERGYVLMDSSGDDILEGGMERDLLVGGRGGDALTGGPGFDDFVLLAFDDQPDTITDFSFEDPDRVVLSLPSGGQSAYIDDYVQLTSAGGDLLLEIDLDGGAGPFDDAAVILAGVSADISLREFWEGYHLSAGDLVLRPYLDVEATEPLAYEDGSTGIFTVTRGGDLSAELTVNLDISGSAQSGVDYEPVSTTLAIPAGRTTAEVRIVPFVDSVTESSGEVVHLSLVAGEGYAVGETGSALVEVRDPIPVVTLTALAPRASQQDAQNGTVLLRRRAAVDEQALIFLELGGSATNGIEYDYVSTFVLLDPGETLRLIPIVPRPGAALPGGSALVQMRVTAQPDYLLGKPSAADVTIVERTTSYTQWVLENFPDAPADLEAFGAADPGGYGVPVRQRYAFGFDARQPASRLPGAMRIVDGHLFLEVGVRPGGLDLRYVPEVSLDGRNWQRGPDWAAEVPAAFGSGDPERRLFRATKSMEELEKQLLRVRAE